MNFEQAVNLINSLTNTNKTFKLFCANQEKILKRLDAIATPTVKPMVEDLLKNDFVNYQDANYVAAMACEGLPTWVDFYGKRAIINFAKQLESVLKAFPLVEVEEEKKPLDRELDRHYSKLVKGLNVAKDAIKADIDDLTSKRKTLTEIKCRAWRLLEDHDLITGPVRMRLERAATSSRISACAYFLRQAVDMCEKMAGLYRAQLSAERVKVLKAIRENIEEARECADMDCAEGAKRLRRERIELIKSLPKGIAVRFNGCRWIDDFETIAIKLMQEEKAA